MECRFLWIWYVVIADMRLPCNDLNFKKELFDIQVTAFPFLSISETIMVSLTAETGFPLQFLELLCEPLGGTGG